jgi:replication fork protection complex subunit Tof1/Swi1
MSESPLEDDQEIAENILNRIFYEETTHDRVASILQNYKDQEFGYLDACTELTHVYLRMLEQYSKQNVDLQVRSRRRARKGKKKTTSTTKGPDTDNDSDGSADEDLARAHTTTRERKFNFAKYSKKFLRQGCINAFVVFVQHYHDLNAEQLKRAHRFFYRIAFKMDFSVMLFRVDIIALLHRMIKGPGGLDPQHSAYKEWDELVRQLIKRLTRKLEQRPILAVELLFSKIDNTAYFLETGQEDLSHVAMHRPAVELEVEPGMNKQEQIGVAVAALLNQDKEHHLEWVSNVLAAAQSERLSWEQQAAVMKSIEEGEEHKDTSDATRPAEGPSICKVLHFGFDGIG